MLHIRGFVATCGALTWLFVISIYIKIPCNGFNVFQFSDEVYMMLDLLSYLYVRASLSNAEDGRLTQVQRPELGSLYLREESRLARGIAPGWLT